MILKSNFYDKMELFSCNELSLSISGQRLPQKKKKKKNIPCRIDCRKYLFIALPTLFNPSFLLISLKIVKNSF